MDERKQVEFFFLTPGWTGEDGELSQTGIGQVQSAAQDHIADLGGWRGEIHHGRGVLVTQTALVACAIIGSGLSVLDEGLKDVMSEHELRAWMYEQATEGESLVVVAVLPYEIANQANDADEEVIVQDGAVVHYVCQLSPLGLVITRSETLGILF